MQVFKFWATSCYKLKTKIRTYNEDKHYMQ